jgi:hypothetical protein
VQFGNPVYRIVQCETAIVNGAVTVVQAGSQAFFPADLVLHCVVTVHDEKTRAPERWTQERKLTSGKYSTQSKVIKREDVVRTVRAEYRSQLTAGATWGLPNKLTLADALLPAKPYKQTGTITNDKDKSLGGLNNASGLTVLANYYLDQEQATYQPKESLEYSYAAIMSISPDGVIQQVSWSVGLSGASTRASKNSEFNLNVLSHAERRNLEVLRAEKQRLAAGGKPQSE